MAGRVTIQDIADELGVSRNTVSKAINNTGILADATRERILQKAVEMGYKQFSYVSLTNISSDNTASDVSAPLLTLSTEENTVQDTPPEAPSSRAAGNIALFTTMFLGNSHFASTMLDKVQRELASIKYSLTIHLINKYELENTLLPYSFDKEATSGIMCIEVFDPAYSDMICSLGLPVLFVDSYAHICSSPLKADRLLMDNRTNIYCFIKEMADRGKKRIGFIGEYLHCLSFFERYMGYREALITLNLPCKEEYSILGNKEGVKYPTSEDYREYLTDVIKNLRELPDVFICANDFIALDVLQAFNRLGISVPKDVYLCGFDDSSESRITTPPLTTIHIHSQIMGFTAVHLLISRIKEPGLNYRTVHTETSLIYRESTED